MTKKIVFEKKQTNFYRYPCKCVFQDKIENKDAFTDYLNNEHNYQKRPLQLYFHIPFCISMCTYCPFFKVHYKSIDKTEKQRFVFALIRELEKYAKSPFYRNTSVASLFFGGGTPMVLEIEFLEQLIVAVHQNFNMQECEIISIEGDPISLQDKEKIKALKTMGMTRTSMGIQTFNQGLRKKLGIVTTVADIYKAARTLESCGVYEWGTDLLYNCPDQNLNEIRFNVDRVCELGPTVTDNYDLIIPPNTRVHRMIENKEFKSYPSNKNDIEMFKVLRESYFQNGYEQVRSTNFQPKGVQPNPKGILYTLSSDVIGIGPSARGFSYSAGINCRNHCSMNAYMTDVENGAFPLEIGNQVADHVVEERDMVLFPYFMKVHKDTINYTRFKEKIQNMVASGYVVESDSSIELTELGKLWAGNVQFYFHSEDEKEKMVRSTFLSIQHGKNAFNQDDMNCLTDAA